MGDSAESLAEPVSPVNGGMFMMLFTKELLSKIPSISEDMEREENGEERYVVAKFFTPDSNWYWYLIAYDPLPDDNGTEFAYGIVKGFEVEFGMFPMNEVKALRGPMGLPVERDRSFKKMPVKEVYEKLRAGEYV